MSRQANAPLAGLAWLEGQWGDPATLSVPLDDRGLQLADGLFETVLISAGLPQLLEDHLRRWHQGAALLAMASPPALPQLCPLIGEAIARSGLADGALRLNWSRGSQQQRGIQLPATVDHRQHRFWLTLQACSPSFAPITAMISRLERRNADSMLSRCKTFAYGQAIQARREAQRSGQDDALLLNTRGELCCGSSANLMICRDQRWLTPPLTSGCLPGVMRGRALSLGLVQEAKLDAQLQPDDEVVLINSLSCRPIRELNGLSLKVTSQAELLWRTVLNHPTTSVSASGGIKH
jgi:branched-chain amino acid aminotransferase